jgi:hypothetical protein
MYNSERSFASSSSSLTALPGHGLALLLMLMPRPWDLPKRFDSS